MRWPTVARRQQRKVQGGTEIFQGWIRGLNTAVPSSQIMKDELASCVNFKINAGGQLETRKPIKKYITGSTTSNSKIVDYKKCIVDGTEREIVADANGKIYYVDDQDLTAIDDAASGEIQILNYNGSCTILDGGCIKYVVDDIDDVKVAYDDGSGTRGCQFDNSSSDNAGSLPLGDGTNSRIAYKFTSQSWDTGYTIPITRVKAKLSKTLTPTGNLICKLRLVSNDSILASKTMIDVSTLDGDPTAYEVEFSSSDITTEMSPGIAYYASLEYAGGDGSNYVNVHYSSGTGTAYIYTASWAQSSGKDILMRLGPGKAPKAKFGDIQDSRLFTGGDSDNPGYVNFSNLSLFDWSTSDGGGYVGAVDDDANSFEVGAIVSIFGDLYVFGTQNQPYLCRLKGDSPSDYILPALYQKAWTNNTNLVNAVNDCWFASATGFDTLKGVEYYGDVRTRSEAESVIDRFRDYWSDDSVVGHDPYGGCILISMPEYHRVLCFNIKNYITDDNGNPVKYPSFEFEFYIDDFTNSDNYKWVESTTDSEYYLQSNTGDDPLLSGEPDHLTINNIVCSTGTAGSLKNHEWDYDYEPGGLYKTIYIKSAEGNPISYGHTIKRIMVPTAYAAHDNKFFMCSSDGYIYEYEPSYIKDADNVSIFYNMKTASIQVPFRHINIDTIHVSSVAESGAYYNIRPYKNNNEEDYVYSYSRATAISDGLRVGYAEIPVEDATYLVDRDNFIPWFQTNFDCHAFQYEITDVIVMGIYPLYINGILTSYRRLEK